MSKYYDQEPRVNRDRIEDAVQRALSSRRSPPDSARKIVGSVFNGGAMPTTVPAWFLTHPADFGCLEVEGGGCSATIDSTNTIPILVLGPKVPSVGDLLPARMIGGKWVAGSGGTPPTGCTFLVNTTWCACVIPGTITVTVRQNNASGAVVTTAIAGSDGFAHVTLPSSGTYWFGATTTASGYVNTPTIVNVLFTSNGTPCNPGGGTSRLSPPTLSLSVGGIGSCTLTGPLDGYTGTITANYPGNCGCGGQSFPMTCRLTFCTSPAVAHGAVLTLTIPNYTDPITGVTCPGIAPPGDTSGIQQTNINATGVGPGFSPCLPVNLSFTSHSGPVIAYVFGSCTDGAITATVTQ